MLPFSSGYYLIYAAFWVGVSIMVATVAAALGGLGWAIVQAFRWMLG